MPTYTPSRLFWSASGSTDVVAYNVYAAVVGGNLFEEVDIGTATPRAQVTNPEWFITNLTTDTYDFVITAVDSEGTESDPYQHPSWVAVPLLLRGTQSLQNYVPGIRVFLHQIHSALSALGYRGFLPRTHFAFLPKFARGTQGYWLPTLFASSASGFPAFWQAILSVFLPIPIPSRSPSRNLNLNLNLNLFLSAAEGVKQNGI